MGQRRGPLRAFERSVDETHVVGLAAVKTPLQEIEAPYHDSEHVVEVVRDAAGQLSDCFHFLGLPKLGFETFATRDFVQRLLMRNPCQAFCLLSYCKLTFGIYQRQPAQRDRDQARARNADIGPPAGLLRREYPDP